MSAAAVRACPFCGNDDPEIDEVDTEVWALVCQECGCTGPIENYDNARQDAEKAINLWNRRA